MADTDLDWDYLGRDWAREETYDDPAEDIPMVPLGGDGVDLQTEMREAFIREIHERFPGGTPSDFLTSQLEYKDGAWYYKTELAGKQAEVKLTGRDGRILARSTIEKAKGGRDFFQALNAESTRRQPIPLEPRVVLRQEMERIEMETFRGDMDELQLQEEMESVIDNPDAPLTADDRRELRGAATTLAATTSKIKSANLNLEWASKEREKASAELERARDSGDETQIKYWDAEVKRFETQESLYRATRDMLQKDERSQFGRIKDILDDKRRPLAERLRELFRKEGVTIASLATAVGMTIAAIAMGVANALSRRVAPAPSPAPPGPKPEPSIRDRIKDALKRFGQFLLDLAKKSAAGLPGLIGTVVGFVFKTAGQAVGFLAEHLLIGLIALVAIAFEVVMRRAKKMA